LRKAVAQGPRSGRGDAPGTSLARSPVVAVRSVIDRPEVLLPWTPACAGVTGRVDARRNARPRAG